MDGPELYTYTDYRQFLEDWLIAKKGRISQRGLAKKVGCSPSLMSAVISANRHLAQGFVVPLMDALRLTARRREYFQLLVDLEAADSRAKKDELREMIRGAQNLHAAERIVEKKLLVFTRWYYPAIVELTRCDGFNADPAWIAQTLVPKISQEQAREALDVLLEIGFLVERDGRLSTQVPVSATDSDVKQGKGRALTHLHEELLTRAAEALTEFPREERHFGTLCFALPAERLPELKQMVTRFEQEVIGRFSDVPGSDRVFQVGFQVYPMSVRTRA